MTTEYDHLLSPPPRGEKWHIALGLLVAIAVIVAGVFIAGTDERQDVDECRESGGIIATSTDNGVTYCIIDGTASKVG